MVICLYGDYHNDDRILKKAGSLSKFFDVTIISVTKKRYPKIEDVSKSLHIKNIFIKNKIESYIVRYFNSGFWKKIVKENPADIYDCNDPDTMMAGIYAKKYWKSKIVYDAHELWSDVFEKKSTIIKTIYAFISTKILYYIYEKPNIKLFDKIITVNIPIKKILENRFGLDNIFVIYNFSNYDCFLLKKKKEYIVYIGGHRFGIEDTLVYVSENIRLTPLIIGFNGNYKEIEYLGFLTKEQYRKKLRECKIGLFSYDLNNSRNTYLATPNKIFQYIQGTVPVITFKTPGTKFLEKYNVGETYKIGDFNDLIIKINKILNNYEFYIDNINKYKKELSWENQEKKLIKIYK